jgi:membrane protease YdiL (CAAX protease family)
MKRISILLIQLGILPYCVLLNIILKNIYSPFESYILGLLGYWLYIAIVVFILVKKDKELIVKTIALINNSKKLSISVLAFIPVILVFIAAIVPSIEQFSIRVVICSIILGIYNGLIEELFWRGITIVKNDGSLLFVMCSTVIFGIYHFAYLVLSLTYQGGALALVGGALVMGIIWMTISLKTKSITTSIIAHQIVNIMAFSSLFMLNNI